jgi:hypothetical protein
VALALALLIALAGLAGGSVLAPDRSINAVAAFVSLLGLHALTLTVWLLGLLATLAGLHVRLGDWSLAGWRWAWGALAFGARPARAGFVARGFGAVMQRQRLWPWLTGLISPRHLDGGLRADAGGAGLRLRLPDLSPELADHHPER